VTLAIEDVTVVAETTIVTDLTLLPRVAVMITQPLAAVVVVKANVAVLKAAATVTEAGTASPAALDFNEMLCSDEAVLGSDTVHVPPLPATTVTALQDNALIVDTVAAGTSDMAVVALLVPYVAVIVAVCEDEISAVEMPKVAVVLPVAKTTLAGVVSTFEIAPVIVAVAPAGAPFVSPTVQLVLAFDVRLVLVQDREEIRTAAESDTVAVFEDPLRDAVSVAV